MSVTQENTAEDKPKQFEYTLSELHSFLNKENSPITEKLAEITSYFDQVHTDTEDIARAMSKLYSLGELFSNSKPLNEGFLFDKARKVNLWDVAKLPQTPKTLLTALQSITDGSEYWIHEFGNKDCPILPSFWKVSDGKKVKIDIEIKEDISVTPNQLESIKKEIKTNVSRKQYCSVQIAGKSFDCHKLSACAFIENHDPLRLTNVDHRTAPSDELLVVQTQTIWLLLKRANNGNMHSVQPHFCNFTPYALQWLSPSDNSIGSSSEAHKKYKKIVTDYNSDEALEGLGDMYDKDDSLFGDLLLKTPKLNVNEWNMSVNLMCIDDLLGSMGKHDFVDPDDQRVKNTPDLIKVKKRAFEKETIVKCMKMTREMNEKLRFAKLGKEEYIRSVLKDSKDLILKRLEEVEANDEAKKGAYERTLVGFFEKIFNLEVDKWTEYELHDVCVLVEGCVFDTWHPMLGVEPTTKPYMYDLFADWVVNDIKFDIKDTHEWAYDQCEDWEDPLARWKNWSMAYKVGDIFKAIKCTDEEKLALLEIRKERSYNK